MTRFLSYPLLLLALGATSVAHAEKADTNKPTNIEADQMAYDAMRVLAMAYLPLEEVPPADSLERPRRCIFAGLVGMSDPLRPEVRQAIIECRSAGIRPVMITGDHPGTARAVAEELGILATGELLLITNVGVERLHSFPRGFARV